MKQKTFISHSSKDKSIVRELADKLTKENIWFDAWNMDTGDILSEKIEKGIDEAKNFLIILSKNSIDSPWVKYELNMALIKYLEEEDYKIFIARIDDVEVPLRLKPFLRIDSNGCNNVAQDIYNKLFGKDINLHVKSFKRQFINRQDEISALQDMFYESDIKFINIIGFYGIGKSSLIQEAFKRIYANSKFVEINLSQAHFGSRLTLDLCSKAGVELPPDGVTEQELNGKNLLAIETLLANETFVVFNRFESVLDDSGSPNNDIKTIFEYFKEKDALRKLPFITLSTRWADWDFIEKDNIGNLKIGGLTNKHLSFILKSEIERSSPTLEIKDSELLNLADLLHGYPLAGKLAAPFVVKFGSIEFLSKNLHIVNQIKIDIAEDIISKVVLAETDTNVLELLAIFEYPLNPIYISETLGISADTFNICIDNLTNYNLIETDGTGMMLHPLINDYYLKLARSNPGFGIMAEKLANISKNKLESLRYTSPDYVYWLTNTCRLLFYCGKLDEGRQLRYDLLGEVKVAAIRLYQNRDYSTSLKFCNNYLETKPEDKDILFTKARCLSRIGDYKESENILNNLVLNEHSRFLLAKYYYALGRAYIENSQNSEEHLDVAEKYFMKSIGKNEHPSALQSMSELLYRKGKLNDAASFIERKLKDSPADPFALSIYADILWSLERKPEAIDRIMEALKHQPKNPNFLFRAGRFLQGHKSRAAYGFFRDAIRYDSDYIDARLSIADTCLDLNYIDEAKMHLNHISKKAIGEKKYVYESIRANLALKEDNIDAAEEIASGLIKRNRDVVNLGLLAKIYIAKYRNSLLKGFNKLAESDKNRAIELINEGLSMEPSNEILRNMLSSLK